MNAEPGASVAGWLADFERAVNSPARSLPDLFRADSHWRDLLALTWSIQTVSGAGKIGDALSRHLAHAKPSGFTIDSLRTPPRHVIRAGTQAIEAIFRFETAQGRGSGVVRLIPGDGEAPKAWTLLTALDQL